MKISNKLLMLILLCPILGHAQRVDPKDIERLELISSDEKISDLRCDLYGPISDEAFAIDFPRLLVGQQPCAIAKRGLLEEAKSDRKLRKKLKDLVFGEKRTYEKMSIFSIVLKIGEVITLGPAYEERTEVKVEIGDNEVRELETYENKSTIAKDVLEALIKNQDTVYFNQYGLCYRQVAEVRGLDILPIREKVECSIVQEQDLIFVRDY